MTKEEIVQLYNINPLLYDRDPEFLASEKARLENEWDIWYTKFANIRGFLTTPEENKKDLDSFFNMAVRVFLIGKTWFTSAYKKADGKTFKFYNGDKISFSHKRNLIFEGNLLDNYVNICHRIISPFGEEKYFRNKIGRKFKNQFVPNPQYKETTPKPGYYNRHTVEDHYPEIVNVIKKCDQILSQYIIIKGFIDGIEYKK